MSGLSSFRSVEKVDTFSWEVLETDKANYVPFAVVMAAARVPKALNRSVLSYKQIENSLSTNRFYEY